VRLSDYAVGRDNNFTLLRFAAAMTVLFAHSVAVLGLPPEREFFFKRLGFSLGEMGLEHCLATSGILGQRRNTAPIGSIWHRLCLNKCICVRWDGTVCWHRQFI